MFSNVIGYNVNAPVKRQVMTLKEWTQDKTNTAYIGDIDCGFWFCKFNHFS